MHLNTLTLAERERLAYAEGFTTTAALLAQAVDNEYFFEIEQEGRQADDLDREKQDKHNEREMDDLRADLARLEDQLFTMRELVEQAADYLKAGDVDGAGCTLAHALA
jgi:hypothetical protein